MPVFILIGNTSVKVEAAPGSLESFPVGRAARLLKDSLRPSAGEGAVIASVNPSAEKGVEAACRRAGLRNPTYAGRDFPAGVEIALDSPESVGIDRILNVKAAFARSRAACAAVDLGTAVSVSVADESGRFVGGAIMPGIGLSLRCLAGATALLPAVSPAPPDTPLARDTASAMRSGCVFGALGAIREIVGRTGRVMRKDLKVILTGGDAQLLASLVPEGWLILPGLTLEGLRLAYEETR